MKHICLVRKVLRDFRLPGCVHQIARPIRTCNLRNLVIKNVLRLIFFVFSLPFSPPPSLSSLVLSRSLSYFSLFLSKSSETQVSSRRTKPICMILLVLSRNLCLRSNCYPYDRDRHCGPHLMIYKCIFTILFTGENLSVIIGFVFVFLKK